MNRKKSKRLLNTTTQVVLRLRRPLHLPRTQTSGLQIPDDDLLQGYFFTKLRKDVPTKQPLILLCSSISQNLMQLSMHFSKVRMLKTPIDGFALYRALNDLLLDYAKNGNKTVHPRYLTDQHVEVYSDVGNSKMPAVMKNLSLSGAYFETKEVAFTLASGDFCKMSIMIGNPAKQYVFDVRVIWCKQQETGAQGYGVTFVNKEEVYNHLLKHL
jgi:hypothetical protein